MAGLVNTLEVGDQIDSYRIEAPVSRSRIATVYRAADVRDGRKVALKVPDPEMETDPFLLERFRRAATIGEKLGHHGVMWVFSEVERSRVYMVMEWCEGKPLRQIMDAGKVAQERAIRITTAVLEALQYLHDNGVVHRDLTPDSIMVDEHDKIKADRFWPCIRGDFSTSDVYKPDGRPPALADYVSPEQVAGKRGDGRSDIYTMGVILYEMVTGKLPFMGSSPLEAMKARISTPPIPPSSALPSISPHLQEVLYRALEKDPRNRYSRAHDFAHDLQNLDRVGIEARPELRNWRNQKSRLPRTILLFLLLLLIPVAICS